MYRKLKIFRPLIKPLLLATIIPIQKYHCTDFRNIHSSQVKTIYPTHQTTLYPSIQPNYTSELKVSQTHTLYYEESGNPQGMPVIILHGGPGGGTSPVMRQFHNPSHYRIIMFDQRGCGKSKPSACLENNTTWDLVEDIEKLREHLKIEKWQVFGGSWGSTLAISYAEKHPQRVKQLVLRGIFLLRKQEIEFFYQKGASFIFPEYFDEYKNLIDVEQQDDLLTAYGKLLDSQDKNISQRAAQTWTAWEMATSKLYVDPQNVQKAYQDEFAEQFAKIENHYFRNKGFFSSDNYLLENVDKIRHIPTVIVQGRYDVVCPIRSAWDLHKAFPEAELKIIADSGHSAMENGIISELVNATNKFMD